MSEPNVGSAGSVGQADPSGAERPQLRRTLTGFAHTAITYSIVGPTIGLAIAFSLGLTAGPAFIWGFLLVGLGVLALCLVWAELASHYPYAASMYQWPRILAGRAVGWFTGWMYVWVTIILAFAFFYFGAQSIVSLFGLSTTHAQTLLIALALVILATVLNASGTRLLGRLSEFAVIAEWTVIFVIGTGLLITGRHHGLGYLLNTGSATGFSQWIRALFGVAILPGLLTLFMFETGGTLGEDTIDAHRRAPRGILMAFLVTMILGTYLLIALTLAVPNLGAAVANPNSVSAIITKGLSGAWGKLFLALLVWISVAGGNATFMAAARQVFGMVREGQLPGLNSLSKVRNGTPWAAILVVGVLSALPLFLADTIQILASGLTAVVYFTYAVVLGATLFARFRGWPKESAPFSLGRIRGTLVTLIAFSVSIFFLYLLLSKTDSVNPPWKLGIPVAYWLGGVPLIVGAIYYTFNRSRIYRSNTHEAENGASPGMRGHSAIDEAAT